MGRMVLQIPTRAVRRAWRIARNNPMPAIALCVALASMLFVRPDAAYLGYFDWHTLLCLWGMLAVLSALRGVGAVRRGALHLVRRFDSTRSVVLALSMVTFLGSAFLTNDVALLTFLPLSATVLSSARQERLIPFAFIMQTLAANLGGMILPFGNPQNLFLFSYFHLSLGEFVQALAIPFAASLALVVVCCLFVRPVPLTVVHVQEPACNRRRLVLYLLLFVLVVLGVLDLVPYGAAWAVTVAVLVVVDFESQRHVDYGLLLTFVCFFVFSGNLTRIPGVQGLLTDLLQGGGAFIVGVLFSQAVSNVPSAVLLAPCTTDWVGLLRGVDIGGLGTPIASLASLITLAEYARCRLGVTGAFLLRFEACNFAFLAVLVALVLLLQSF